MARVQGSHQGVDRFGDLSSGDPEQFTVLTWRFVVDGPDRYVADVELRGRRVAQVGFVPLPFPKGCASGCEPFWGFTRFDLIERSAARGPGDLMCGRLPGAGRVFRSMDVQAYQHGIYPRSEDVVAATRGRERGRNSQDDVERAFASDRQDFLRAQQEAGLDYFSDGLLRWQDIFRPFVEICHGMDAHTLVRWFDTNSFFRAPEVTGELALSSPVPKQMEDDRDIPDPKMATLPSPYLFSRAAQTDEDDRNAQMRDLTREILRPVAQELSRRGYRLLHLQEPWLVYFGTDRADWDDFEKAVGEIREATEGATLVLNTYFGDAGPYADRLRRLPVDAVGIDFVETDVDELGTKWEVGLLAGVLDGRRSPVEPVKPTVEFARRAAETVGASSLFVSSNSGLELLPRDIAQQKVLRLGEISAQLKDRLR